MGNSVNKVILIGRLGADPELRYTQKGGAVCQMSLATDQRWKDDQGELQQRTSWHRVVSWGRQGELCKEYLNKGRQVFVEGRLQTRSYKDKDGNKKYATEVISNSVIFLDSKRRTEDSSPSQVQADDDLPF